MRKTEPINADPCTYTKEEGYLCSKEKPSKRWYYDQDQKKCVQFEYKGCGGNKNNFFQFNQCAFLCSRGEKNKENLN